MHKGKFSKTQVINPGTRARIWEAVKDYVGFEPLRVPITAYPGSGLGDPVRYALEWITAHSERIRLEVVLDRVTIVEGTLDKLAMLTALSYLRRGFEAKMAAKGAFEASALLSSFV